MFVRTFAERMMAQRLQDPLVCCASDGDPPGGSPGQGDGDPPDPPGKTLTQTEINAIVEKRLSKERKKHETALEAARADAIREWRDEMGLDDEALEKASKLDEHAKQLRDLNKQIKAKDKEIESLVGKLGVVEPKLKETLTRDAVLRAAAGKANDPNLLWLLMKDQGEVRVDEDYQVQVFVDGEQKDITIGARVDQLLAEHKQLAAPTGTPGSGSRGSPHQGGNSQGGSEPDLMTTEGLAKAFEAEW